MKPRFKLDENIPVPAELLLRSEGYDVETALTERLGGAPDPALLDACRSENRVLVTLDLDFADIRAYPPAAHSGVWVLRPVKQSIATISMMLRSAIALVETESTANRLWIVEPERIRIRS